MHTKFQLWLDESGEFEKEDLLKKKNYNPSLIGGILVKQGSVSSADLSSLIDAGRTHAKELSDGDKTQYVLPVLERLKRDYGARQVFFENTAYENESSNRQLYLRMMAEGLLQLMQRLSAEYESVELDVIIAQRQDVTAPQDRMRISEAEYIRVLNRLMVKKKKEHRILINEDSELNIRVRVAAREKRLQLADFACNTRLTRNSEAFSGMKERLDSLYEDAYLFELSEITSVNLILQSLTGGDLSDALMELFTTYDPVDEGKILALILSNMNQMDYRILKIEIRQFIAELIALVSTEDDYAVAENILNRILEKLIPIIYDSGLPFKEELHFHVLLRLMDMYLRQGDLIRSAETFNKCRKVHDTMSDSLENVFLYFHMMEKGAYLSVHEYNPEKAVRMMKGAVSTIKNLMNVIDMDLHLKHRFQQTRSSYLGDALRAEIYAMLFVNQIQENWYEEIKELIQQAMSQYEAVEGEKEKLYCYQCYAAIRTGKIKEAVSALFAARSVREESLDDHAFYQFLEIISRTENLQGCREYLLYYILVMEAAQKQKEPIAERMYKALLDQRTMMIRAGLQKESDSADGIEEIDLDPVQEPDSGIEYYPAEALNWKYASYLADIGKMAKALKYYQRASELCFAHSSCTRRLITGIGVLSDQILCFLSTEDNSGARLLYLKMKASISEISELPLKPHSKSIVKQLREQIFLAWDGTVFQQEILKSISEQVTISGMLS